MELRWNLDALYTSFDSAEFQNDFKKCEERMAEIGDWVRVNTQSTDQAAKKLEEWIRMQNDMHGLFLRLIGYSNLVQSVEAKNEKSFQYIGKMQKMRAGATAHDVAFNKWVASLDNLDSIIDSSEFLQEYRFYLNQIKTKDQYRLSEAEEVIIAKMSNTGAEAWSSLQQVLASTLMVEIEVDGQVKQLPLSVVRMMAYEKDQAKRKLAYEAELKAYPKIEQSMASCLNGIKGQANTVAEMRGYKSLIEQTCLDARMDEETLNAMLTAMRESLPVFHKYYRRKGELLGHTNGLPFYDMFAPMGTVDMTFTYEEARDYIVENFGKFNPKLANLAAKAFDNQWIDAEPREGKQGGAFCSNLHMLGESRVLTNFTGSFSSVSTLAHELGHAYHGECLLSQAPLNSRYPMPLAETASIFAETIIFNAALESASDEEAFVILEKSISNAGQTIVDILSRFIFESEVVRRRKDHALSVKELNEVMLNAQKEAYGDGLDHNYLHQSMWIPKGHYYYSSLHFYNFPYAFGLLFAKGIYAEYLRRGKSFVPEFDRLLTATGNNNIADVAKMVGIDVRSSDFWRSSLALIAQDVDKFVELSMKK